MRKITFLLTLLLMYIGVTPMMAFDDLNIDVNKIYTIKTNNNYYLYLTSNFVTYRTIKEVDLADEKYHFVFEPSGSTSSGNTKYYIRPVSSQNYLYDMQAAVRGVYIEEGSRSEWCVVDDGNGKHLITTTDFTNWWRAASADPNPVFVSTTVGASREFTIEALDGSEVGGGESGGNEGGDEVTIDYTLNSDFATAYHTNVNGRRFNNVTINGENVFQSNLNTTKIYHDATDKEINVEVGANIQVEFNYNSTWMNGYVYIDEDRNGFSAGWNGFYSPAGDLKSYSFYSGDDYSDGSGRNSSGTYFSGDYREKLLNPPSFKAPTTSGTYRMRLKIDWNSIDPKGDNNNTHGTIKTNGGVIVDVTLVVTPKKEPINLTLAQISNTDKLLYGLEGYIGTFSAAYNTEIPEGVTAYYASAVNGTESIKLTELVKNATDEIHGLPANFGVILVASPEYSNIVDGKAVVTMSPTDKHFQTAIGNNEFKNSALSPVKMVEGDYVLAKTQEQGIGFYQATGTLGLNKTYIHLDTTQGTSAFRLVVDETVTGVEGVATEKADAPIYDLSGRRVLNTVKGGIYIQNGKKFIVK